MTYRIAKWAETFEAAESRRPVKGMTWMQISTRIDSRGACALSRLGHEGMAAYGVFVRLCQWYAQRELPERTGDLVHSDGEPMDFDHLSFVLGLDVNTIDRAFATLAQKSVRWIELDQSGAELDHARSDSIKSDQVWSLQDRRGEERKESDPSDHLSARADAPGEAGPDSDAKAEPPTSPELAEQTVESWNAAKAARDCEAWPDAGSLRAKSLRNLRARRAEYGADDEFGSALADRLDRMAASDHYRGASGWVPSLPWLLEPGGWEKAGNLPPPGTRPKPKRSRVSGIDLLAQEMGLEDWNAARNDRPSIRAAE